MAAACDVITSHASPELRQPRWHETHVLQRGVVMNRYRKVLFCAAWLLFAVALLVLYGCGGDDEQEFSCEITRTISSTGMEISRTYDCPDEASCDACSTGDCAGCTVISEPPDPDPGPSEPGSAMCMVGLVVMQGESCSFDDGVNMFTLLVNERGQCCMGNSICAGNSIQISGVVFSSDAAGNCVVDALP